MEPGPSFRPFFLLLLELQMQKVVLGQTIRENPGHVSGKTFGKSEETSKTWKKTGKLKENYENLGKTKGKRTKL